MLKTQDLAEQLSLFRPRPTRPEWKGLPPAVQEEIVALLARMLREDVDRSAAARGKESTLDE